MLKTMQLREAKAKLSAVVTAAENGETTIVTRNGKPAAMVVPFEEGSQTAPGKKPNFADWLLSMPHDIPIRRNRSRARSVKF